MLRVGRDDSLRMTTRKFRRTISTAAFAILALLVSALVGNDARAVEAENSSDALLVTIAEANRVHRSMQGRLTQRTRRGKKLL